MKKCPVTNFQKPIIESLITFTFMVICMLHIHGDPLGLITCHEYAKELHRFGKIEWIWQSERAPLNKIMYDSKKPLIQISCGVSSKYCMVVEGICNWSDKKLASLLEKFWPNILFKCQKNIIFLSRVFFPVVTSSTLSTGMLLPRRHTGALHPQNAKKWSYSRHLQTESKQSEKRLRGL